MEILPVQAKLNVDVKADATPVIQAVADVVHSPQKGIGKILNALVGPWVASRERVEALLRAQTERDCKRITDGSLTYRDGNLLSMPGSSADIYTALHSLNHQADAKRLEAAVLEAVRQISDIPPEQISDEPLSQTFFNRWRREAEMIDEEDLRILWANLLKEETVKPDSISPKTLDVVKNLSRQDCERFLRVCRGAIKGEVIVNTDNLPVFGTYQDIVALQDVGLLNQMESSVKVSSLNDSEEVIIRFYGSGLAIKVLTCLFWARTFSISLAGMDLLRVLGEPRRLDSDIIAIRECIASSTLESFASEIVHATFCDGVEEWEWIRGSRPACFD